MAYREGPILNIWALVVPLFKTLQKRTHKVFCVLSVGDKFVYSDEEDGDSTYPDCEMWDTMSTLFVAESCVPWISTRYLLVVCAWRWWHIMFERRYSSMCIHVLFEYYQELPKLTTVCSVCITTTLWMIGGNDRRSAGSKIWRSSRARRQVNCDDSRYLWSVTNPRLAGW